MRREEKLGSSPSPPKNQDPQKPVNGAENGILESNSGCHIGQIWRMAARYVRCSSTLVVPLPVGETVSVEPESNVAQIYCATVKGDAPIIAKN